MCGIAGFVHFTGGPGDGDASRLDRMSAAIAHRGPDGWGRTLLSGATIDDRSPLGERRLTRANRAAATDGRTPHADAPVVGLAHRRLAIIDLSEGGHQPMAAADGGSWITYNGELYNYRALRDRLVATGTPIRTGSDTEVLLAMLATRDIHALDELRGMFAFAWWDDRSHRLVLARDRFGIKPLVYAETAPGRWVFASEPASLAAAGCPLVADPPRRDEVRARGAVADDASFWRGLKVVAPGECVILSAHGETRRTYWSLGDVLLAPAAPVTARAAAAVFREALAGSVQAHLVSDVPVGLFLSGGLDSAAILATVRDLGAGPIRTFTVTMGEGGPGGDDAADEAAAARETARQFGGEHTELRVGDLDLDATLDEFFASMAEPTFDGLNTFIVARAARQAGVRVALSGVGGDELLGGYASFRHVPRLSAALTGLTPVGRAGLGAMAGWLAGRRADKLRAVAGAVPGIVPIWWQYRAVTPEVSFPMDRSRWPRGLETATPFAAIRYLEWREYLQRQLLRDADAFTMAHALELRTPLVDHHVVAAMAAAGAWPRDGARSFKAALFQADPGLARRGSARARKQGFVLPMARWMREALSPQARRWRDLRPRLERHAHGALIAPFLDGRLHWSRVWAAYVVARVEQT